MLLLVGRLVGPIKPVDPEDREEKGLLEFQYVAELMNVCYTVRSA